MPKHTEQPTDTQPESTPTDSAEPINDGADRGEEKSEARAPSTSAVSAPDSPNLTVPDDTNVPADTPLDAPDLPAAVTEFRTEPEPNTLHVDAPQDTGHPDGDTSQEDSAQSEDDNAPASSEDTEVRAEPAQPAQAKDGRLAPGALRQMVIDHLHAHPDEAFTATRISRIIEKSSGAIANALVKLAAAGIAEQVTDRPRTFRLTQPNQSDPTP
ncbi:hypothetical protein ABT168_16740 [Streptomyces sp. NPDC001793]|uniref:hypothetical protein n=1 Tax=Streptomyces sp. NPDC001793 TaxID=3154657 RepID=UPI00332E6CF9